MRLYHLRSGWQSRTQRFHQCRQIAAVTYLNQCRAPRITDAEPDQRDAVAALDTALIQLRSPGAIGIVEETVLPQFSMSIQNLSGGNFSFARSRSSTNLFA